MKQTNLYIVEDNEVGRIGFRLIFERDPLINIAGESSSAPSAIEEIMEAKPDVILLKREMPEVNGIELTRQLRDQFPEAKVLLFTSHIDPEDMAAFLAAGGSGCCLSSISVENLILAIRSVANGALWFGQSAAEPIRSLVTNYSQQPAGAPPNEKTFRPVPLTERENDVLRLIADGLTNQQIAEKLNVSTETVKTHIRRIMDKSAIRKRRELIAKAIREQMI